MKTGCLYGAVASVIALVALALAAPIVFAGRNMASVGQVLPPVALFVVGVPAFVVGYMRSRNG